VPRGLVIGVDLTQPELAALTGSAEVTIHKALAELRRDELITTGYRRTTVLDLNRLWSSPHPSSVPWSKPTESPSPAPRPSCVPGAPS
jgi:hypothetical protein